MFPVDWYHIPTQKHQKCTRIVWLFDRMTAPMKDLDLNTARPQAPVSGLILQYRKNEPVRVPLCPSQSKPGICLRWSATIPMTISLNGYRYYIILSSPSQKRLYLRHDIYINILA